MALCNKTELNNVKQSFTICLCSPGTSNASCVLYISRKCLWVITAQTAIMQTAKPEGGQSQWEYFSL